jgi:hypothetical protein
MNPRGFRYVLAAVLVEAAGNTRAPAKPVSTS